jgi:hypothetical protein
MTPIVITFVVLVILLVVLIKEEGKSHPSSGLCFRRGAEADTYQRFGSWFSVKDKGYATQYTGGAVSVYGFSTSSSMSVKKTVSLMKALMTCFFLMNSDFKRRLTQFENLAVQFLSILRSSPRLGIAEKIQGHQFVEGKFRDPFVSVQNISCP